ncbi:hypothetical protein RHSIM_Rhsim12G0150900 [Rhododendron simsii]|uniref:NOSIC domain-containing protein n=1 Tax=Rhododendron simsii TaxID=118357 RepID=A0A834GA28_RHOSS|nr:hypothetical protein RHSIM_Rhsim12G0150900 [Rhododendron simsii]
MMLWRRSSDEGDDEWADLISVGDCLDVGPDNLLAAGNYADDLGTLPILQTTQRYVDTMHDLDALINKDRDLDHHRPEYQIIVDCNALSVDIDDEILTVHNFIRDNYRYKFPELESLVLHPIDYARLVKKIGNETDLTLVDLEGLVPSAMILVISITASTTGGKPLSEEVLRKTIDACDRALALDSSKTKVLDFLEGRMGFVAPNLSAVVGSAILLAGIQLGRRRGYRDEIRKTIEKWQELPPAKRAKLLPVPDCKPAKKKRGGRRLRKMKQRYAMTDERKKTNRMKFGVPEE